MLLIYRVDHKFVHVADILRSVFSDDVRCQPISYPDRDNCRVGTEVIVDAKWRRVHPAFEVQAKAIGEQPSQ